MNRNRWRIDAGALLAAAAIAPADRLQRAVVPFERGDLDPRHHLNVGQAADALDQIGRHGRRQGRRASSATLRGLAGEEDRRLARAIAAADQRDLLPGASFASSGEAQ